MLKQKNLSISLFSIYWLLIALLFTTVKLQAQPKHKRHQITIQNPKSRMLVITPQMLQQPELHKIQLYQAIDYSRPGFTLYHHTGRKVLEKQLELSAPISTIALDKIIETSNRLPAGYYYYRIQKEDSKISLAQSDTLFFRDVSNTHLPMDSTLSGYSEFADVNGDLFLDIITGFTEFHQPQLLMNDGTGRFIDQTSQRFPQIEIFVSDVAVVDIDLDNDLDIFFVAQDTQTVIMSQDRLFLNDGSGFFSDVSASHLPQLPTISQNVDWGFINDDVFPDLLISSFVRPSPPYQTSLFILINDSSGHFNDHSANYLPETTYGVFDAALADVNGDSLNDIVLANQEMIITDETGPDPIAVLSGQNAIFVQNDNNQFVDETMNRMPSNNNLSKLIKVTDINNDSAPELYVINIVFFINQQELYLNDGNGIFQDVTTNQLPQQNLGFLNDVEFRDFDANGYVDMYIVNNILGGPAADFLNLNENGVFRDVSNNLPTIIDFGVSATSGDIDKDGDFDIFVSTTGGSVGSRVPDKLLENLNIVVSVSQTTGEQPIHFELSHNYPNPFNPTTAINYVIPESRNNKFVALEIYNSLGQKVRTLVNASHAAGAYQIHWQGKDDRGFEVSAGVYMYRLSIGSLVEVKKMLLLK